MKTVASEKATYDSICLIEVLLFNKNTFQKLSLSSLDRLMI
jgi:hypothetical protein